jgi:ParB family chromosome partitioning protein
MTRKALGKGLEALFGNMGTEVVNPKTGTGVLEVEISKISPNPFQPRQVFSAEELSELSESIREKGLLQPILLRKHGDGYQIVAGERRFRATQLIGRETISAQVRDHLSDRDMMEMALIENLQRVQLNPIEEAEAFEKLINACGITHDELAHKLGKSRSAISNTLRLLKLDGEVQGMIRDGKLSAGHGRAILQAEPSQHARLAHKMVAGQMNVRHAEKTGSKKTKRSEIARSNPNTEAFLEKIRYLLGTKVVLKGSEQKGVLEIHYMNRRDLDTIADLLQKGHDIGTGA